MQSVRRTLLLLVAFSFAAMSLCAVAQRVIDTVSVGPDPMALAVNSATNKIYVTTATDYTINIIDGATDNTTTLNVGLIPLDVAVDSTRDKIYVVGILSGFTGGVTVIDGATLSTTTVQVGRGSAHVAVNPTTNKIYVTNSADDTVTVIDGATLSTTTVQIGQYTEPTTIKVNEIADKIWVLDYNANSVTVIDGTTLSTTAVPVGQNPVDLAINRSTNKVFVTIYDYIYGNTVTVIDGVTLSTTSVNVGIDPYFVAVNEATNQIYVTHSLVDGVLTIIDGATLSTSSVPAGPGPSELAVDGVRNKIYVINAVNQYHMVTVIDGSDHSRTAVRVGIAPVALVINQVTNRIYVSNEQDNTVSVIDGTPPTALQFVPLAEPCRAVDTRPQYGGGGPILGGTFQNFPIQQEGNCNIPASAAAYSMNVSVVPQGPLSYLTVWPAGQPQPLASTLNSLDGRIKANAAIIPAGANREISVYATNTTNVIVDVNGYFAPVTDSTLAFYPLPPCRVADTRYPNGSGLGSPYLTGGQERDFPILNATPCN
ncbi:MAG: YncE family protein, partial [Candidatus Korobacteraceae bacterium]